jgi:hypothetical protein
MTAPSFADYLSSLDEEALARLLTVRADARVEPVPQGFNQLAQRLSGPDSIGSALRALTYDSMSVGEAIAVLGESATVPAVARLLRASEQAVDDEVAVLCGAGLAWQAKRMVYLPEPLLAHWAADLGGGRPVAKVAAAVLADDLRAAAAALGVAVGGLSKKQLITQLTEAMADTHSLVEVITALPPHARVRLEELRLAGIGLLFGFAMPTGQADPTDVLVEAGLVLRVDRRPEVPREVAVAAWLAARDVRLTGRPAVAPASPDEAAVLATAQAAAREAVRALSTLLDEAGRQPLAALKKGGVGARERGRLAKRLSIPEDLLALWIDLAYSADLLGEVDGGYAPTEAYPRWRAAELSEQWAALAVAWYRTDHAPLMREIDDGKDAPPPIPLMSMVGVMRHALLREARAGLSVRGVSAEIDWFCPVHGYEPTARDQKMVATMREAELLGVTASDRVTELGAALLAALDDGGEVVAATAERCRLLLPDAECTVILQSDLTAVVSGQPSAAVSRLLAAAGVNETHGNAAIWRFTPASVRAALDAGWTAAELLTELAAIADRAVPQPLEYLVNDVARRHGQVRVRTVQTCVVADEALVAEIVNTRQLAKLRLSRIAPTVLTSPRPRREVLDRLRAAGMAPVAEDAAGVTIVEDRREHLAESGFTPSERPMLAPTELAKRLVADPDGDHAHESETVHLLARFNPRLDDAELALLSHAVDTRSDVMIACQGEIPRQIRPYGVRRGLLDAFCHLTNGDRSFGISSIESVFPVF